MNLNIVDNTPTVVYVVVQITMLSIVRKIWTLDKIKTILHLCPILTTNISHGISYLSIYDIGPFSSKLAVTRAPHGMQSSSAISILSNYNSMKNASIDLK